MQPVTFPVTFVTIFSGSFLVCFALKRGHRTSCDGLNIIHLSFWISLRNIVELLSCITSYVVSFRQARGLPVVRLFPHPASFRFHLAMDTLAFGYVLPTAGRLRDFHLLETCAARRTITKRPLYFRTEVLSLLTKCYSVIKLIAVIS